MGCKTFGVCLSSEGNIEKIGGKKDGSSELINFLAKEKMFLAKKEVIWLLNCICRDELQLQNSEQN